ncbi:MAG: MaoC/PaaZ C-terminal domain-containing protein [Anaerolineae bacterium]|nr:MaoC/PaaZ C-terminal domain-containing protein [Anaerolineae bacterium]MDW8069598.1 MaoC/PaaZ C-terminal domain-containing protein [Anaerolineae bacterium]
MEPRGRYFEDIAIGEEIESAPRTITEADILAFAELSGDTNPLHIDPEYARTTIFGERIAHGLLGLSVASGLAWQTGLIEGTAEAFIGLDWKFRAPIRIGDTVRLRMVTTQKREMPHLGGGLVTLSATLLNQRDEVVQKGTWTVLVRARQRPGVAEES